MPYVSVPRDLSKVKSKIMFGLTKRQVICLGAAAVASMPLYLLALSALGANAVFVAVIPAFPFFLMGFWLPKDGQPLEKKVMNYISVRFRLPRVRPYKTENTYVKLELLKKIQEVVFSETEPADAAADNQ